MSPFTASRPLLLYLAVLFLGCTHTDEPITPPTDNPTVTITFGSCLRQWQPQPVWRGIQAMAPAAFVFLGDNMYADVGPYRNQPEPERIRQAYRDLATDEQFQSFRNNMRAQGTTLFATWDDHDYGINDGGGDYSHKLASKRYFLDFFNLQSTASGDANQAGIYHNHRLERAGLAIQFILLDTRSFRSPLKKDAKNTTCRTHTVPNTDPGATILGERQWQWLERTLRQPADLRILASSIQVIPEQHCYEKWANFPLERQRLFQLLRSTRANGVILVSGDRHLAEVSRLPPSTIGYPLYEITSSGLNSAMGLNALFSQEENRYRQGDTVFTDNFGAIAVHQQDGERTISLQIHSAEGELLRRHSVPLSRLALQQ